MFSDEYFGAIRCDEVEVWDTNRVKNKVFISLFIICGGVARSVLFPYYLLLGQMIFS